MPGPIPRPGQVVGCRFPTDEDPLTPSPKFRPGFVMAVNEGYELDHPRVCIAYGTGQRTSAKPGGSAIRPHEFEVDNGEAGSRLTEQTRFNCERYVWLPFTEDWFQHPNRPGSMVASYGAVPSARKAEIRSAMAAGRARIAIDDMSSRTTAPGPALAAGVGIGNKPTKAASERTLSLRKPAPPTEE
jgi:hypothetical protein